jgi:hypothetical protein
MIVMLFMGVMMVVLAGSLKWTSTNALLNQRNNEYNTTLSAAEAATEKVLASVSRDFQNGGEGLVVSRLNDYRAMVPTNTESGYWNSFQFRDTVGTLNRTHFERTTSGSAVFTNLNSQYSGLYGLASDYRLISNARRIDGRTPVNGAIRQRVQLASIPLFQFAIFYSLDLEINPGPAMTINGRVHGNSNIYMQPVSSLTFNSHVTAAGDLVANKSPLDPTVRGTGTISYNAEHDSGVASLTLPVGTNNSPDAVRQILGVPPTDEPTSSLLGQQRYHNKSDLVVIVNNGSVTVKSGGFNNFSTAIPWSEARTFLNTNVSFYNPREAKWVKATQLDVGALRTWSGTNNSLRPALGNLDVSSVYIADLRTQSSTTQPGVKIVNGQTLPNRGLTISSPAPIYIQGHFNAPAAHLGTTNTTLTKPASVVADAINILSTAWSDANSDKDVSLRVAQDTTVNAAFIGGIVPSNGTSYSGGVENFPRFLENWNGKSLRYNGSMVVMFASAVATAPWSGNTQVYSPPRRDWSFDLNFLDPTKLPPGTPSVRAMIRGEWASIAPNSY